MELIIEEISQGHKLLGRHKCSSDTITIGRGYNNDLIISDPHICADHIELKFDGKNWQVYDLGSINGSAINGSTVGSQSHIIKSGDIIALGKSKVRIVFPNHPVPSTVEISPFESVINIMKHPVIIAFNLCLFSVINYWLLDLNNITDVNITQLLVPTINAVLGFALWPAAIALTSHLTKHDARFWTQLGVTFLFFNLMLLGDGVEYLVNFNLSATSKLTWMISILSIALTYALFWLNCYIGFHMSHKRRNVITTALVILLFGGNYLLKMSKKPDFNPHPFFNNVLMSPNFLFNDGNSVDKFIDDSRELFNRTAKKVAESKRKTKS